MYIIGRGRLVVVAHDGRRNFASLTDGDYFGEVEHRLSRRRYKLSGVQTKLGFGLELGLGAGGCALGGGPPVWRAIVLGFVRDSNKTRS